MKFRLLCSISLIAGTVSSALLASPDLWAARLVCPVESLGETPSDCPWAGVARELEQAGREGEDPATLARILEKDLPDLAAGIAADRKLGRWKALWGTSINYDEIAKKVILDPKVLQALERLFGTPSRQGHLAHAGMEHTYGYLFSVLPTPFGYKRARWVRGEIEKGFGLPEKALSPMGEGSLFSRVTYFAGQIAFRTDSTELKVLSGPNPMVPGALRSFDFSKLHPIRIIEEIRAVSGGRSRDVVIRTDLVPFLHEAGRDPGDTHLLVYSVVDPLQGGARLITAFPVASSFAKKLLSPGNFGGAQPISTRYNGFVDGVTGTTIRGTRKMERF